MSSITDQIINETNAHKQYEANQQKATGQMQKMDQDMFMKLMMEQLKYQDPLSPMDSNQFLAQQAQFTQVSEMQALNDNISQNNFIMQTLALVGKEVTMIDPEDPTKTITGVVSEASFNSKNSSIIVNGKEYPLSLVQSVKDPSVGGADKPVQLPSEITDGDMTAPANLAGLSEDAQKILKKIFGAETYETMLKNENLTKQDVKDAYDALNKDKEEDKKKTT